MARDIINDSGGLYRFMVSADYIVHGRWLRACAEGNWVGECRTCGGYLRPEEPEEHDRRFDYEASCTTCGHIILAPDGRVLASSSLHSDAPRDWWEKRPERLAAAKAARGGAA